jgi:hypothetical protein
VQKVEDSSKTLGHCGQHYTRVVVWFAHHNAIDGSLSTPLWGVIACEHDLPSGDTIAFDMARLNKALKPDIRFKGAEDPDSREAGTLHFKRST